MAYQPWIGLRTNRPCRHAPYRDCRRYILSHHGAGPYAHAAAYLYIVYYAHSRTDMAALDNVAPMVVNWPKHALLPITADGFITRPWQCCMRKP